MEKEYFTPEIEDIYVGYECEVCTNYGYEAFNEGKERWIPLTIGYKDQYGTYVDDSQNVIIGIDDGYQPCRVPYLTQEQIEAEGWTNFAFEYKGNIDYSNMNSVYINEEKNYMLAYNYTTKKLDITMRDPAKADIHGKIPDYRNIPRYNGECKDINTFRKIIKLLKI